MSGIFTITHLRQAWKRRRINASNANPQPSIATASPPSGTWISLCWPLAAQTESKGALRGTVVNEATGNYVEGAVLTLTGTNRTAVTDSQGRFHFGALPPAGYRLKAEAAGNFPGELIVRVAAGVTAPALVRSRP